MLTLFRTGVAEIQTPPSFELQFIYKVSISIIDKTIPSMAHQMSFYVSQLSNDSLGTSSRAQESSTSENESNTPTTLNSSSQKRKRSTADIIWSYSRQPIPEVEIERNEHGRKLWYCKYAQCAAYKVSSTNGARHHMRVSHGVIVPKEEPSKVQKRKDGDLRELLAKQKLDENEQKAAEHKAILRNAANDQMVQQSLLRLIVHHDLPLSLVEWPELHTLVYSINPEARHCLWQSHRSVATHIAVSFDMQKRRIIESLQQSLSLIHITTDTWHSPNHKELQAITAHWIDARRVKRKALLNLPELLDGHSGAKVAPWIISTAREFGIEQRLGYITTDNHKANDTMCAAISEEISEFDPQERRLRCMGHMINIAIQAFLFAANKEAVEVALEAAESQPDSALEDALTDASQKDEQPGWIRVTPLQKILAFVTTLQRSDKLYNAFKSTADKAIPAPNDTRWNSYLFTFQTALELRAAYQFFIVDNPSLIDCELGIADWQLVDETVQFLLPFKEATKRCEGDFATLDMVQTELDSLSEHFKEQAAKHKLNTSFSESIITGWYAFDKYYKLIDQSAAYTAAILLHPTYRRSYLQHAWKRDWIEAGVNRTRALWLQSYKKEPEQVNIEGTKLLSFHDKRMAEIDAKQRHGKGAKDEFERFIIAPSHQIEGSVLNWWLETAQQTTYPQLSRMAIDILSAPLMSAESERVFSAARRTIGWTRARLQTSLILQLECLKHWHRSGLIGSSFDLQGDDSDEALDLYSPPETSAVA